MVEILSSCPVCCHMESREAVRFIDNEMTKTFPLGVFKDWEDPVNNENQYKRVDKKIMEKDHKALMTPVKII